MRPRETAGPWLPSVSGSLCQSQAWSCSPDTRPSALKGRAGTALAVSEECELPGLEATQRPDHRPSGLLKSVGHRCPESSSSQALGRHFPQVTVIVSILHMEKLRPGAFWKLTKAAQLVGKLSGVVTKPVWLQCPLSAVCCIATGALLPWGSTSVALKASLSLGAHEALGHIARAPRHSVEGQSYSLSAAAPGDPHPVGSLLGLRRLQSGCQQGSVPGWRL